MRSRWGGTKVQELRSCALHTMSQRDKTYDLSELIVGSKKLVEDYKSFVEVRRSSTTAEEEDAGGGWCGSFINVNLPPCASDIALDNNT